jgi:hypothetical protein
MIYSSGGTNQFSIVTEFVSKTYPLNQQPSLVGALAYSGTDVIYALEVFDVAASLFHYNLLQ